MQEEPKRWGATADEWRYWAYVAGRDLLPAVCSPEMHQWPRSARLARVDPATGAPMALHKTPSRAGSDGTVYGVAGWTQHIAEPTQVEEWARAGCYNTLLVCRSIRAIDIDIEDHKIADHYHQYFEQCFGVGPLPYRGRPDSGKRTLLVRLDYAAPLRKKVIHCQQGVVEFLADLQQTVVAGTHPKGAQFTLHNLPQNGVFPVVSFDRIRSAWDTIRAAVDPGSSEFFIAEEAHVDHVVRLRGQTTDDPVLKWLHDEGWVVGYETNGTANVRCPWENEHSQGGSPNATSWLPKGLGGKDRGGFRCLHAHCEHRKTNDFLRAVGHEQAQINIAFSPGLPPLNPDGTPKSDAPLSEVDLRFAGTVARTEAALKATRSVAVSVSAVEAIQAAATLCARDPNNGKTGHQYHNKVMAVNAACESGAVKLRHDEFAVKDYVCFAPSTQYEEVKDTHISKLRRIAELGLGIPVGNDDVSRAMDEVLAINAFDSAQEVLTQVSSKWDGTPRLDRFGADILRCADSPYAQCMGRYLFVAMAGRILLPGAKADIVPIFISPQGTGKSTLIQELALMPEWFGEISLESPDADLFRLMAGKVVLEWPELKGLSGRDADATKAFITLSKDTWVPKYKEKAITYLRRSIIVGNANRSQVLVDPTGNRRFAPITVATTAQFCDHPLLSAHREQYWAEAVHMIANASSPAHAIEREAVTLRRLAEPFVRAATLPWHRAEDLRRHMAGQPPGSPVTLGALGVKLFGSGTNMDRARAYELRAAMTQEGYTQAGPDAWLAPTSAAPSPFIF